MAENIIARKPIIGSVAVREIEKSDAPQAYKNIDMTSKTTNMRI
jgi:hypothetical protein